MRKILTGLLLLASLAAVADVKISQLPLGSAASTTNTDVFPFVNSTSSTTSKMTLWDLINLPPLASPAFTGSGSFAGTLGIGTTSPAASSLVDMESTTKGFIPPRMTGTQKNAITSPATGLVVFDTTLANLSVYNGASWVTAGGGSGGITYAADTGSANAYAIAPTPAASAYHAGDAYVFLAAHSNTSSSTLNVSSLGTKAITEPSQSALIAGDIVANALVVVIYDGTQFQMIAPQALLPNSKLANEAAYTFKGNNTSSSAAPGDYQSLILGTPSISDTGVAAQFTGSTNGYEQVILQNTSNGAAASADFVVNNNNGTASTYYGDFGINSSGFTGSGSLNLPNASYLYSSNGDLVLGTNTSNGIHLLVNGSTTDAMAISSAGAVSLPALSTAGILTNTNAGVVGSTATVPVANGGTNLSSGTSGGILGFTGTGTIASSGALTANQLVIGGGAGVLPSSLAAGSQYVPLTMGASSPGYTALALNQSAATSGQLPANRGGTGLDTSSSTGTAQVSSGTWSVGAIPLGNTSYVSGQLGAANGGLGLSTSASTGVPSVSSGTWSIGSTLSTSLGGLGINAGSSTGAVFMSSGSTTVSTLPYSAGGTNAASQSAFQANASPLTTKGDVATYSTLPTRIAVPGDYGDLVPDSGATTGWRADSYTAIQHGRPGKNYIQYADFENSATTGWTLGTIGTLTNGLPTGTPTFGSGASGNLSLSTVAGGTALAGTHSLSYVSSAATTQGNMMASSSYAVDQEDEAKVMTVKFYYQAATLGGGNFSGTSSNSYAWAAYDVTNSAWLSSAGNFCMTQSSGTGYCTGTFQTAATTANFRLVLYNANATTGAATTYFDDFYVGPQTAPMGPAITDWVAYTPTIVGFGSTTGVNFWSRRFGDSLEVHGYFTAGTTTSTTASITLGYNGANANVSTDTTKSTAGQYVGHGTSSFSSSTFFNIGVLSTASTTVNLGVQSSTAAILTAALGTSLASTGQVLDFMWRVPIVGWSSNTAMSSDTDTRVVALDANAASSANLNYNAGSPNSTVPTSAGQIVYGTTVNDTHGAYNSTTGVYTIPVTGWYAMTASYIAGATTTHISDSFAIQLYNATTSAVIKASAVTYDGAGASGKVLVVTAPATYLTAGTQVYVRGLNSGSTTPVYSAGATYNYISISRVSGPAVVAATESVNMRYHAASTSISGSAATITYTTADFDSHNAYASGTYTVPVSGKYQVNAYAAVSGTFALNSTTTMALQKNGSDYAVTNNYAGGVITNSNVGLSDTVNCLAGDTLRIQLSSSATGPAIVSSNTKNWLSIERVGN